jgi:hypothetical protein
LFLVAEEYIVLYLGRSSRSWRGDPLQLVSIDAHFIPSAISFEDLFSDNLIKGWVVG